MRCKNGYCGMECVIYFGKETKETWLGFQQKRAELAVRQIKGMNAAELHGLQELLMSDKHNRIDQTRKIA